MKNSGTDMDNHHSSSRFMSLVIYMIFCVGVSVTASVQANLNSSSSYSSYSSSKIMPLNIEGLLRDANTRELSYDQRIEGFSDNNLTSSNNQLNSLADIASVVSEDYIRAILCSKLHLWGDVSAQYYGLGLNELVLNQSRDAFSSNSCESLFLDVAASQGKSDFSYNIPSNHPSLDKSIIAQHSEPNVLNLDRGFNTGLGISADYAQTVAQNVAYFQANSALAYATASLENSAPIAQTSNQGFFNGELLSDLSMQKQAAMQGSNSLSNTYSYEPASSINEGVSNAVVGLTGNESEQLGTLDEALGLLEPETSTQTTTQASLTQTPLTQTSSAQTPSIQTSPDIVDPTGGLPSFYQAVPVYAQNYTNSAPQLSAYRVGSETASHAANQLASTNSRSIASLSGNLVSANTPLAQAAQVGPTGNALHMKLSQVAVQSDSTVLWNGEHMLQEFMGQEIDAHLLQRVINQVSRYYRDLGYTNAQAFLPEQSIMDGQLQVYVATTKLQAVELENQTAVNDDYLDYLLSGITEKVDQSVNQPELESQLLKLSDLGVFDIRGGFRPLDSSGLYADLDLLVVPHDDRALFTLFADNHGNKTSGRYRFGGQVAIKTPFGLADNLSLFYARTNENQNNYSINYELPVNSHPSVLGFNFCYSNYELGQEYQILGAQGHAYTLEGYWREPIFRDASNKVDLQFGMRYRKLVDEFANFDVEFRKHTIAGYAGVNTINALNEDTSVFGNFKLTAGKLYIDDEYKLMPEDSFYLFNIEAGVQHRFTPNMFWKTTVQAQLANTALDGSEQFLAGGAQKISALGSSELFGDTGLTLRNELLFSPFASSDNFSFNFGPHIEAASVSNHGYSSESAASAGIGFNLWAHGFMANLDCSTLLGDKPAYAEDSSRILFTLGYTF